MSSKKDWACEDCKYWNPFYGGKSGECRKNSPVYAPHVYDEDYRGGGLWPVTNSKEWCGEWKEDEE
jgi:hypothetical protein